MEVYEPQLEVLRDYFWLTLYSGVQYQGPYIESELKLGFPILQVKHLIYPNVINYLNSLVESDFQESL